MKVIQLHEWTPKQFLNSKLNPKISHLGHKKTKTKVRIKGNIENESYSTT